MTGSAAAADDAYRTIYYRGNNGKGCDVAVRVYGPMASDGRHGTVFGVAGVIEPFAAAIDFPPDPDDGGLGVTLTSTVFRAVILHADPCDG